MEIDSTIGAATVPDCLDTDTLTAFSRGELAESPASDVKRHLASCNRCRSAWERIRAHRQAAAPSSAGQLTVTKPAQIGEIDFAESTGDSAQRFPKIPGYRITGIMGQGGMGVVYQAVQIKLNRSVALKVLPAIVGSASPAMVTRFRREATAAARLQHTNIIPVYDFGESPDGYYYAMEGIIGQPMNVVIERLANQGAQDHSPTDLVELLMSSTSTDEHPREAAAADEVVGSKVSSSTSTGHGRAYYRHAASWMADVADALHYAHSQSVIHRDVKPANLILSVDGRIMVADFGLAKLADEESMTVTGSLLGTIRYISPEQAMARRVPVDHRTDIFSLGVTMYELLAFKPAFPGDDDKQILASIIARDPVRPRKLVHSVPAELETICFKAIEKSPDARYSTARAMAEDLRRYLNDLPIEAKRPGPGSRAWKFARRRKALTVAVIAGVVTVTAVVLLVKNQGQLRQSDKKLRSAETQLLTAEVQERDARVQQLIEESKTHATQGRSLVAMGSLREALALDQNNAEVMIRLAQTLKDLFNEAPDEVGDTGLEEALGLCQRAVEIDSRYVDSALNTRGVLFKLQERYEEAVLTYQEAIRRAPEAYAPRVNLGTIYALNRKLDDAKRSLEKAAELATTGTPYEVDPWRNLAAYQLLDRDPRALQSIETAFDRKRDNVGTLTLRARILLDLPEHANVDEALRYAITADHAADGLNMHAKRILALAYLEHGEFRNAIQYARSARDLGDQPAINLFITAVAHAELGELVDAREAFDRAIAETPDKLTKPAEYIVTAPSGVLWFDTADELLVLQNRAQQLLDLE